MHDEIWREGIDLLVEVFPHIQAKPNTWRRFLDDLHGEVFLGAVEKIVVSENINRTTNMIALIRKYANNGKRSVPDFLYSPEELQYRNFYLAQLAQGKDVMPEEQKREMLDKQRKCHHLPF